MKETLKLGFILFLIAAVCTGILAVINSFTSVIIAERQAEELKAALTVVAPGADEFNPVDEATLATIQESSPNVKNIYEATSGGTTVGYVFDLIGKGGYGGDIAFILGVESEGKTISGLQVLSHGETPGFGASCEEPWFAEGAIGAADADGIQAISGATKTTNAFKNGIREAFQALDIVIAYEPTVHVVSQ